jgi:hypothetical protein
MAHERRKSVPRKPAASSSKSDASEVARMTLDEFWGHIDKSKRKDPDAHAERLIKRLAKLKSEEIIDFDDWWNLMHAEAYHWDLWGAAYLINGGCSDDGFIDFRSWLVLQGRDVFQAAVANPDTLADVELAAEEAYCECYPASAAWFEATGSQRDEAGYAAQEAAYRARYPEERGEKEPDLGEQWDFDDYEEVRKRLPRLAARFIDGEDA